MKDLKEIFNKIEEDIKEYGFVVSNTDFYNNRFENVVNNISVQYNKRFSENINFVLRSETMSILDNFTTNIKDFEYIKNKIMVLYSKSEKLI